MIDFGIREGDIAALATFVERVEQSEARLVIETERDVAVLAEAVAAAMSRQFEAGTDKHGVSHNKTGATLRTLRVHLMGATAVISMGCGAVFVEYGTKPHVIEARPGGALHWTEGGQDFFARSVHHPGSAADDFVGRAIDEVEAGTALAQVLEHFSIASFAFDAERGVVNYELRR